MDVRSFEELKKKKEKYRFIGYELVLNRSHPISTYETAQLTYLGDLIGKFGIFSMGICSSLLCCAYKTTTMLYNE